MSGLAEALAEAQRQAGLTARYAVNGVGGLAAALANPLAYVANKGLGAAGSDYRFPEQYGALQEALSSVGLPEPQGAVEKGVGFAAEMGVPDPSDAAKVTSAISHMIDPQMAMTLLSASKGGGNVIDFPVDRVPERMKPYEPTPVGEVDYDAFIKSNGVKVQPQGNTRAVDGNITPDFIEVDMDGLIGSGDTLEEAIDDLIAQVDRGGGEINIPLTRKSVTDDHRQ